MSAGTGIAAETAGNLTLPLDLQKAMSKITDIGSLPEVTAKIVEVVENPKSSAAELHEIVRGDPALAAKVLKVVNSAFYGLPSQISSLERAIVMLGLSAVKNISLAASLSRLFKPGVTIQSFSPKDLWSHSVAVGICARMLAEVSGSMVEESFVGGLVHDMGLLIELQVFPDRLKDVVERSEKTGQDFCGLEREIIGADHQAFGAYLSAKWKFPPGLRYAISYHHNPEHLKPEFRRFVTLIQVADAICCQNDFGFSLTARSTDITDEMLTLVGVTAEQIEHLLDLLPVRFEEAQVIFGEPG